MKRSFAIAILSGVSLSVLAAHGAIAQTAVPAVPAAAPAEAEPAAALGEIVVTAQKRDQNLQDVPLAVQVIGANQLEANAVREFTDLTRVAPSLIVRPAENPVNASVSMRGVGTFAFGVGVESSVAVQVDDVPVAFQARAFADLSDVERIEVLRGPQSTLYGKAASAGLINIVTPNPTKDWSGRLSSLVTTDREYNIGGLISGPITSTLGFRSANSWTDYRGNVRNLYNGEHVNGREGFATRNKLVWTPNDRLDVKLSVDYLKGEASSARPFIRLAPDALYRGLAIYPASVFIPGVTVSPTNNAVVNNVTTGSKYEDFAQSLRLSYDLGPATVLSITSHDRYKMHDNFDQDESALPINNRAIGTFTASQVTQEFRLVSNGAPRLRYTLGAFFSDVDIDRTFFRGPVYSLSNLTASSGSQQWSAFGQLEYNLFENTTLIGGARYGREEIDFDFTDLRAVNAMWAGTNDDTYATYKLGVQQRLSDDVMLFALWATGHKGQTYDLTTGYNQARFEAGPIEAEESDDFEVGVRSQFLNRRLTLNATVFSTTYDGFQAQGAELQPDGTQLFRLANVGKLRTRGVELEAVARLVKGLSLSGSAAYLDAEITDFPGAPCYPGQTIALGCVGSPAQQDLSHTRAPQAPKWKLSATAEYSRPLIGPLEGFVQVAGNYQSKVNYSLNADPETVQGGYGVVNLSAGVRNGERGYRIAAFVNNLFDKHYYTNFANNYGNYGNKQAVNAFLPRDFQRYAGVRATVDF